MNTTLQDTDTEHILARSGHDLTYHEVVRDQYIVAAIASRPSFSWPAQNISEPTKEAQ